MMQSMEVRLPVDHVSDTAYLVALYRAYESDQIDAKFKDPFAKILSAPKAEWLENVIPFKEEGHWMMAVRTTLLDEYIMHCITEGADTVVNLAAGLDTRPYRMTLPKHLRWIEADFPEITQYKTEQLSQEKPQCELERITVDLCDDAARQRLFSHFRQNAKRTVIITEGLLPYLSETMVRTLARDLYHEPSVAYWLMDAMTPNFFNWFHKNLETDAKKSDVALKFAPQKGAPYFNDLGWTVNAFESFLDASKKLNRMPPAKMMADQDATLLASDSGIAMLTKRI